MLFAPIYIHAPVVCYFHCGFSVRLSISKSKQRIYYGRIVQEMFGCCAEPAGLFWFGQAGSSEKKVLCRTCLPCMGVLYGLYKLSAAVEPKIKIIYKSKKAKGVNYVMDLSIPDKRAS